MRIAICLSGHMRTYKSVAHRWNELQNNYDARIFISTWNYLGLWKPLTDKVDPSHPGTVDHSSTISDQDIYTTYPRVLDWEIESYEDIEPHFIQNTKEMYLWRDSLPPLYHGYRPHNYYSTYYKRYRSIQLMLNSGIEFDLVIISRPDCLLNSSNLPQECLLMPELLWSLPNPDPNNPWWINDILFMTNMNNAAKIANVYWEWEYKYQKAKEENRPETFFEPHGLLKHHFVTNNIPIAVTSLSATLVR